MKRWSDKNDIEFSDATDLFGNNQRYDRQSKGFIASNGVIHEEPQLIKGDGL